MALRSKITVSSFFEFPREINVGTRSFPRTLVDWVDLKFRLINGYTIVALCPNAMKSYHALLEFWY